MEALDAPDQHWSKFDEERAERGEIQAAPRARSQSNMLAARSQPNAEAGADEHCCINGDRDFRSRLFSPNVTARRTGHYSERHEPNGADRAGTGERARPRTGERARPQL